MPNITININTLRPFGLQSKATGKDGLIRVLNHLESVIAGTNQSDGVQFGTDETNYGAAPNDNCFAGQAAALLTGSSLTGTVGVTIDGTAVTVSASGGDAATMTALMTAIRANTTVNRKVTAVNRVMRATIGASIAVGETLTVCGVTFTARPAVKAYGDFDQSSGVAATIATSLALAINRHPATALRYRAVANSAVVHIGLVDDRTPTPREYLDKSGANITINTKTPAQGAYGLVLAAVPGPIGNCCTAVASGTGMTLATANAGKLGGGTGGFTSYNLVVP